MSKPATPSILRVADLSAKSGRDVVLEPDADAMAAMADRIDVSALRKLRLEGRLVPEGRRDWRLEARLGATVVQPCVVTLDPVTTRIDVPVLRRFVAGYVPPKGDEVEMPDDVSIDPLGDVIDLGAVLEEELVLALPLYPRKDGADLGQAVFAEPGTAPMTDEDARPFAGLAALRDRLPDKK